MRNVAYLEPVGANAGGWSETLDSIIVRGGPVLNGTVSASGSKNAALPILFSALLADGKHRFERVPSLRDIDSTVRARH